MPLRAIYATLFCQDIERSRDWFAKLLGREPDIEPMPGLVEWHHGAGGGLQIAESTDERSGSVTLIVSSLDQQCDRLKQSGVEVGEIQEADFARLLMLRDPDGNDVVVAEPHDA